MDTATRILKALEEADLRDKKEAKNLKLLIDALPKNDLVFLNACMNLVETSSLQLEDVPKFIKKAKDFLERKTDKGKLVKESVGWWPLTKNCYHVAMQCLNALETSSLNADSRIQKDTVKLIEKVEKNTNPLRRYGVESAETYGIKERVQSLSYPKKPKQLSDMIPIDRTIILSLVLIWTILKLITDETYDSQLNTKHSAVVLGQILSILCEHSGFDARKPSGKSLSKNMDLASRILTASKNADP